MHSPNQPLELFHATTIVGVRKGNQTVIAGDGQVSLGQTVMKGTARKVRRISRGDVVVGFAGQPPMLLPYLSV